MQIICPDCKFAREVDETKIPARSQVATCPKCQTKFQFRELPEEEFFIEEPEAPAPAPTPDPVPAPEPIQEPEAVAEPEPVAEPAQPGKPAQAELPIHDEPDQDDDPGESLWKRLDRMRPPEDRSAPDQDQAPQEPAPTIPAPSVEDVQPETQPYDRTQAQTPVEPEPPAQAYQEPVEGWNGEFSEDFPDPMDFPDEEEHDDKGLSQMQVPPPFEQLDRYGFFHGLFMTIKLVLFSPRIFFSVMPVGGGVAKPLTFAILVAMIQTLIQFGFGSVGISMTVSPGPDGFTAVPFNMGTAILELMLTPAAVAIMTYFFAGLYTLLLKLIRSDTQGFEGTFRALAYASAPAIVAIFPMLNPTIFVAVTVLGGLWSLILTTIGIKHIHKISYTKVIPVMIVPFLLMAIVSVLMLQAQLATV